MPRMMMSPSVRDLRRGTSSHEIRLFEITRTDGVVLRFAQHDLAIEYSGATYRPAGGFSLTAVAHESGLERDDADLQAFITDDTITDEDLAAGKYRGAQIQITRVDARWPWAGPLSIDVFFAGSIRRDGEVWQTQVESLAERLKQVSGRVVTKACPYEVGDDDCGVPLGPFTETGTITAVEDHRRRLKFRVSGLASPTDDFYRHAFLTVTSGPNAGEKRKVNRYFAAAGQMILQEPFGFDLAPGDTFSVTRGCNGLFPTCRDVFGNAARFGGVGLFSPGSNRIFRNPNVSPRR